MLSLLLLASSLFPSSSRAECVPARETVKYAHSGQYHRVHPSGNFVLYTSRGVRIVDITDRQKPRAIETPMKAEAYPVESARGGWELISSPLHDDGMRYYQMKDLLEMNAAAYPVYKDLENNEYYQSSAELPESTKDVKKIRTLLYGKKYREYTMEKDSDGNFTKVTPGPTKQQICTIFMDQYNADELKLTAADQKDLENLKASQDKLNEARRKTRDELDPAREAYYRDQNNQALYDKFMKARTADDQAIQAIRDNNAQIEYYSRGSNYVKARKRLDALNKEYQQAVGERAFKLVDEINVAQKELNRINRLFPSKTFSNPVLSKDGTLVAAGQSKNMVVYRIQPGGICEQVAETGTSASKVSFSFPENGKLPKLTYTAETGASGGFYRSVFHMDLNTKQARQLSPRGTSASYPGFTKDGRVIYSNEEGFYIVDPNQLDGTDNATCVKKRAGRPVIRSSNNPDLDAIQSAE